jgi:hypothetical protein
MVQHSGLSMNGSSVLVHAEQPQLAHLAAGEVVQQGIAVGAVTCEGQQMLSTLLE